MITPVDAYAERAVTGAILAAGKVTEDVTRILRPADIHDPKMRAVVEAAWDLTAQGKPVDPLTVRAELLRRPPEERGAADGVFLADLMRDGLPTAGVHHARIVRDMAVRREVIAEATRAAQAAGNPAADPYDVAATLHVTAGVLADRSDVLPPTAAAVVYEFIKGDVDYDWLVPHLLERGDRVLLTGGEGGGKSFATRQLAVAAACGVHPFTGARHDPLRVTLVDLENGDRALRRHLRRLVDHAQRIRRPIPPGGLRIESVPSGVDLTRVDGEAWLTRLCEDTQPQMLVIGPLYRMHNADMTKEEPARQMTRVVDVIRARHGCAVVMETHAPHAGPTGRSLRPVGSSLFLRWPEFGLGIRPEDDGSFTLTRWRGSRDERQWPTKLRRGSESEWPWVAVDQSSEDATRAYWAEVERNGTVA
jgi:hypothetical protein